MKKILLVFIAVASTAIASAQVQLGVKAGANFANLNYSGPDMGGSYKTKTDFNAGILASVPLFNSFYLQPEAVYSGQGASTDVSGYGTIKTNLGYINVPVLFKYQHESGLFAETGPQVGFLMSAKEKYQGTSVDFKDETQSVDFSWAFGIGYKIPEVNLGIDLRYNLGLTNASKNDPGASENPTVKNSVFQVGLFYMFSLGGN